MNPSPDNERERYNLARGYIEADFTLIADRRLEPPLAALRIVSESFVFTFSFEATS